MEAVGIGDLHLSSSSGAGGWSKFYTNSDAAILKEAQAAVDYAREKCIPRVFLYGDICDSPKMSYQAHLALYDFFTRNSDIKFYGILGNHDKLAKDNYGSSCDLLEKFKISNFKIFSKPTLVKIDKALVNFLPFPYSDWNPDALNVCHIDVQGSTMDSGRKSTSKIEIGNNVIVAGHIHTHNDFKNCYYSGTMYQTNFGESEKKGFHHINFVSPDDYEILFIPHTPKLILKTVIVNNIEDIKALPSSKNYVYKLLIQDGADISIEDYSHLNVSIVKSFKTKNDLKEIISSKLDYVSISDIRPEDVFEEILKSRDDIDDTMKDIIRKTRLRILK